MTYPNHFSRAITAQIVVRTCEQQRKETVAPSPTIMNEPSQPMKPTTGETGAATPGQLTIAQAADAIGVDSFTMLTFIQQGKINPTRSPSGEFMLLESELAKLTQKGP